MARQSNINMLTLADKAATGELIFKGQVYLETKGRRRRCAIPGGDEGEGDQHGGVERVIGERPKGETWEPKMGGKDHSEISRKDRESPVIGLVQGLVALSRLVKTAVTVGAHCKWKAVLVQLNTS